MRYAQLPEEQDLYSVPEWQATAAGIQGSVITGFSGGYTWCPGASICEDGPGPFFVLAQGPLPAGRPAGFAFFACWAFFSSLLGGRFSARLGHGCLGVPGG